MSDIEQFEAVPNPLIPQPDFKVPAEMEAALDELITHYPKKRSATLMLLHAIQERYGFISEQAVHWVKFFRESDRGVVRERTNK